MRTTIRIALAVGCMISALIGICAAPPQGTNSYSEKDLITMISSGIPADVLVRHVQEWGISFKPDGPALARLEKEGAPPELLDAIRSAGQRRQTKSPAKAETVRPAPRPSQAKPPSQPETAQPAPPHDQTKAATNSETVQSPPRPRPSQAHPPSQPETAQPAPPHDQAKAATNSGTVKSPPPPGQPQRQGVTSPEEEAKTLEAEQHLKLSQLKEHDRDFEGALAELREAGKARPQWAEVFYQRGLIFADLQRYGEAAEEWKKYLAAAGAEADVKTVQDRIADWLSRGEPGERIRRLKEEAIQDIKYFNAGRAIAASQELVMTRPSLDNLLLLAQAYWMKRDYESLSKIVPRALAIDPQSAQATLYQGAVQLAQDKLQDALSTIQEGISLDPKSAFGYELNCDALRLAGDFQNARIQCLRALEVNPDSGFAHNRLGWMLWNQGHHAAGLAELRKAAEAEPRNAYWQSDLAYALLMRKDVPGALAAAREALRWDANCPYSHDAMGMVLQAQGNVSQAILEFKEAVRLAPTRHPEFLGHLNSAMQAAHVAK